MGVSTKGPLRVRSHGCGRKNPVSSPDNLISRYTVIHAGLRTGKEEGIMPTRTVLCARVHTEAGNRRDAVRHCRSLVCEKVGCGRRSKFAPYRKSEDLYYNSLSGCLRMCSGRAPCGTRPGSWPGSTLLISFVMGSVFYLPCPCTVGAVFFYIFHLISCYTGWNGGARPLGRPLRQHGRGNFRYFVKNGESPR